MAFNYVEIKEMIIKEYHAANVIENLGFYLNCTK